MLDSIRRNPSTAITSAFAFLLALIPVVDDIRDAAEPFGIDPQVWLVLSAVLAIAAVLGRMYQAVRSTVPVSWGLPSIFGFVAAAATALTPMIADLADAAAPLGVPNDVWLKVSSALVVATLFGRIYQATAPTPAPGPVVTIPSGLPEPEPVPHEGGANEPTT